MARAKINSYVVNSSGDRVAGAQLEVRDDAGALVTLYADETGATEAYGGSNPFSVGDGSPDPAGYFEFWVELPFVGDVTAGAGAATLSRRYNLFTSQSLGTGDSPAFDGMTLTDALTVASPGSSIVKLVDTAASADEGGWWVVSDDGTFTLQARSDDEASLNNALRITRTGTTVDSLSVVVDSVTRLSITDSGAEVTGTLEAGSVDVQDGTLTAKRWQNREANDYLEIDTATDDLTFTSNSDLIFTAGQSGIDFEKPVSVAGNISVTGTVDGRDVAADGSKLDGIEPGATADLTAGEIRTLYESNSNTNAFTDSEKTKLNTVETGATADQTGAEIKSAYEGEADTNAFTDAEKTKLGTVETNAAADQTGAEIKTAYEAEADTNAFTDSEKTKLGTVESGATANTGALADLNTVSATEIDDEAVTEAKLDAVDTPADGDVLSYQTSSGRFEWVPQASGGSISLPDLSDVDSSVATPSDGDILVYRSAGSDFVLEAKPAAGSNPAAADITDATSDGIALITSTDANPFTDADESKLDGIETGATADQTGAEIKTAYEAEANTNAFTDANQTKLSGIETGATADQTAGEIKTLYESNTNTNAFTDADETKLDGIEALADVTDAANVTAAGALMDSELANIAAVKGLNQDVSTTSSPDFANVDLGGGTLTARVWQGTESNDYLTIDATTDNLTFHRNGALIFEAGDTTFALETGLSVSGNITVTGTVDGRNVSLDGTKLDTVETNADVTDTANVTAAGALMDSELSDEAAIKAIDQQLTTSSIVQFSTVFVESASPSVVLSETDATSTYDRIDFRLSAGDFVVQTRDTNGSFVSTDYKITRAASGATQHQFNIGNTTSLAVNGDGLEVPAGKRVQTDEVRAQGTEMVLNAGESANFATGQTSERIYLNAESGVVVSSSPDNWASGWAGRDSIVLADGNVTADGNVIADQIIANRFRGSETDDYIEIDSTTDSLTYYSNDSLVFTANETSVTFEVPVNIPSSGVNGFRPELIFETVAELFADTALAYTGATAVVAGDYLFVREYGWSYLVLASGGTGVPIERQTAGGVYFRPLPTGGKTFVPEMLNVNGNAYAGEPSPDNCYPAIQDIIDYGSELATTDPIFQDDRGNPGGVFGAGITITGLPNRCYGLSQPLLFRQGSDFTLMQNMAFRPIGGAWAATDFLIDRENTSVGYIRLFNIQCWCDYICSGIRTQSFWILWDPFVRNMAFGGSGIELRGVKTIIQQPNIIEIGLEERDKFYDDSNYGANGINIFGIDFRIYGGEVGWCGKLIREEGPSGFGSGGVNTLIHGTHLFNGMEPQNTDAGTGYFDYNIDGTLIADNPGGTPSTGRSNPIGFESNGSAPIRLDAIYWDNCRIDIYDDKGVIIRDGHFNYQDFFTPESVGAWIWNYASEVNAPNRLIIESASAGVFDDQAGSIAGRKLVKWEAFAGNTWGFFNNEWEDSDANLLDARNKQINVGTEINTFLPADGWSLSSGSNNAFIKIRDRNMASVNDDTWVRFGAQGGGVNGQSVITAASGDLIVRNQDSPAVNSLFMGGGGQLEVGPGSDTIDTGIDILGNANANTFLSMQEDGTTVFDMFYNPTTPRAFIRTRAPDIGLNIQTNDISSIFIEAATQNVGINQVLDPEASLHVSRLGGKAGITTSASTVALFESGNGATGSGSQVIIGGGNASSCELAFADTDDAEAGQIEYNHVTDALTFATGGKDTARFIETASVADDTAVSIEPPRPGGFALITCQGDTDFPQTASSGLVLFDTGSTLNIIAIYAGNNLDVTTGALTGTTGTDGRVTVSANTGNMVIENRTGSSFRFQVSFL